jgi:ABC-type glycerol-3-phosphate transport system permease component
MDGSRCWKFHAGQKQGKLSNDPTFVPCAIALVATFLFVGLWNSLLTPLMYLQTIKLYTLPVYVSTLYNINQTTQPWPTIMTAAVLTTIPLIIIFFFAQRYILDSVVVSGLKG